MKNRHAMDELPLAAFLQAGLGALMIGAGVMALAAPEVAARLHPVLVLTPVAWTLLVTGAVLDLYGSFAVLRFARRANAGQAGVARRPTVE